VLCLFCSIQAHNLRSCLTVEPATPCVHVIVHNMFAAKHRQLKMERHQPRIISPYSQAHRHRYTRTACCAQPHRQSRLTHMIHGMHGNITCLVFPTCHAGHMQTHNLKPQPQQYFKSTHVRYSTAFEQPPHSPFCTGRKYIRVARMLTMACFLFSSGIRAPSSSSVI